MADNEQPAKSSVQKKGHKNPPKPPEPVEAQTPSEDSFVDFGSMASIDEGASGVIPLDQLPDPASSPSVISWTQVIRQHQKQASFPEGDQSVKIDSSSDKDLLARVAQEDKARSGKSSSDTDELSAEEVPLILSEEDGNAKPSSSVELSAPRRDPSKPPSGSAVRFDVPSPPDDAGGVMPMPDFLGRDDVIEEAEALMPEEEMGEIIPEAEAVSPIGEEEEIPDSLLVGDESEEESASSVGLGETPSDYGPEYGEHSSILDMLLRDPGTPLSEVGFGRGQPDPDEEPQQHSKESSKSEARKTGAPLSRPTHPEMHVDRASRSTQPELLIEGEESPLSLPISQSPKTEKMTPILPGSEWLAEQDDEDRAVFPSIARRDEGNPEEAVDLYAEAPLDSGLSPSGSFQVSPEQLEAAERRARLVESSAVDLSSSASLGSNFDINLTAEPDRGPDSGGQSGNALLSSFEIGGIEEAEAVGLEDLVDMSLPEADVAGQDSMIRHVPNLGTKDKIDIENELEARRHRRTPASTSESEANVAEPMAEGEPELGEEEALPTRRSRRNVVAEEESEAPTPGRGRVSEPVAKKKGGGLLVGAFLGLLIAAGAFGAVWYTKVLPTPESVFGDSTENTPVAPGQPATAPNQPAAIAATPALGRQLLEAGDLAKSIETYNKCEKSVPVLAGLGQAKWLAYVREHAGINHLIKRDDPRVAEAIADLDAAGTAYGKDPMKETELDAVRAALWRGLIEESLGNFDAAGKIYAKSAEEYKDHAAVFTTAQKRIEALHPSAKTVGRAIHPQEALLAFMVMLQAPITDDAAKAEAGFSFWDAVLAANKNNYPDAIKAIAKAKVTHLKQRDTLAGKGLNPFSDPREQIFERCCDDLTHYWTLCDRLYKDPAVKELAMTNGADEVLAAILTGKMSAEKTLAEIGEKVMLKKDQKLDEAVESLVKAKKAGADLQTALTKQLVDAGVDDPKVEDGLKKVLTAKAGVETKVKNITEAFDKAGVKEPDLVKAVATLATARDDSETLVKTLKQKFAEAKYIEATANGKDLLKGVDEAITRGSTEAIKILGKQKQDIETSLSKTQDDLAKTKEQVLVAKKETDDARTKAKTDLEAQKKQYDTILMTVKTPAQALDLWLPSLNDASLNADAAAAIADADRVLKDETAKPEAKAKALAVKALALRNQNKITEALDAFAATRKDPAFKDQPWAKEVIAAEDQLRNPAVAITLTPPTAQQILQTIDVKMKIFSPEAFPKENAKLLAQRSVLKLDADDLEGAATDAEAALKADAGPDSLLAVGKVAERQRKWDDAEKNYRAAIKLEKPGSLLWKQAKQGIARVLLDRSSPPADAAPMPKKDGVSLLPPTPAETAALLLVTMFFAPEIPLEINEALKQGDDLIAQKDYLGYILKAKAYALVGKYQEAMKEYSTGIKLLKVLPKEYEGVLDLVIRSHPALQGLGEDENPPTGEKFYSAGIDEFQSCHYAKAERQFIQAIRQNKRDARYLYYLGLSRWMQGKEPIAEDDFRAGALLELRGYPSMRTINDSLERVQGTTREVVNQFRP